MPGICCAGVSKELKAQPLSPSAPQPLSPSAKAQPSLLNSFSDIGSDANPARLPSGGNPPRVGSVGSLIPPTPKASGFDLNASVPQPLDRLDSLPRASSLSQVLGVAEEGGDLGLDLEGLSVPEPLNSLVHTLIHRKEKVQSQLAILEAAYVRSTLQPAGTLDRRSKMMHEAVESVDANSVLFTSKPLSAALSKGGFRRMLLFLSGIGVISSCIMGLRMWEASNQVDTVSALRITVLEARGAGSHSTSILPSPELAAIFNFLNAETPDPKCSKDEGLGREPLPSGSSSLGARRDSEARGGWGWGLRKSWGRLIGREADAGMLNGAKGQGGGRVGDVGGLSAEGSCAEHLKFELGGFGPMSNKWPVDAEVRDLKADGASQTLRFKNPIDLDGWFLKTSMESTELDPVRFRVEASLDGQNWWQIGSSFWEYTFSGIVYIDTEKYPTPMERGRVIRFSRTPSIPTMVASCLHDLKWSVILIITTFMAHFLGENYGKAAFVGGALLNAAIIGTACICFHGSDESPGSTTMLFLMWATSMDLIVGLTTWFQERYFVYCILAYGFDTLMLGVIDFQSGSWHHMFWHAFDGLMIMGIAIHAIVGHHCNRKRAAEMLLPDMEDYELIWSSVIKDEKGMHWLNELASITKDIGTRISGVARQYKRKRPDSAHVCCQTCLSGIIECRKCPCNLRTAALPGKPGTVDRKAPASSLDQLFYQTVALQPILLRKVQDWALASDGSFPVVGKETNPGRPEFVKWSHIKQDPSLARAVKWASVKTEERAIEKLARSYDGDVSRLVDLTRQSIIFEEVSDLVKGLRIVASDPDVVVERIKNRMDPEHDPSMTGGYRDVLINMRIVTEHTMVLGIETHVVELQCILKKFAERKTDQGHRRYVAYRNARGE